MSLVEMDSDNKVLPITHNLDNHILGFALIAITEHRDRLLQRGGNSATRSGSVGLDFGTIPP